MSSTRTTVCTGAAIVAALLSAGTSAAGRTAGGAIRAAEADGRHRPPPDHGRGIPDARGHQLEGREQGCAKCQDFRPHAAARPAARQGGHQERRPAHDDEGDHAGGGRRLHIHRVHAARSGRLRHRGDGPRREGHGFDEGPRHRDRGRRREARHRHDRRWEGGRRGPRRRRQEDRRTAVLTRQGGDAEEARGRQEGSGRPEREASRLQQGSARADWRDPGERGVGDVGGPGTRSPVDRDAVRRVRHGTRQAGHGRDE